MKKIGLQIFSDNPREKFYQTVFLDTQPVFTYNFPIKKGFCMQMLNAGLYLFNSLPEVIMQIKGDASGTSVLKNGSIKMNKVHE